jgi:CRP/FNR family cyclic AMP-dependent transcriptional regulator
MTIADDLKRVPLFCDLSEAELGRVTEVVREREYPKNSVILFEDDPGDALYIVAHGQVKVVLIGEDGREVILSVLGDGDFFGEMSLIDDEPRSAHVIAMKDSVLLVLLDVNGRVARLLLDLADESAGPRITRKLTHHTIAQMIGSSRETVSRAMRELIDRGLIEVNRREITIRNRDGLSTLAGDRT